MLVYQTALILFQSVDFYLTVAFCVFLVFAFDSLIIYFKVFEKRGLIEHLKYAIKDKLYDDLNYMNRLKAIDTSANGVAEINY